VRRQGCEGWSAHNAKFQLQHQQRHRPQALTKWQHLFAIVQHDAVQSGIKSRPIWIRSSFYTELVNKKSGQLPCNPRQMAICNVFLAKSGVFIGLAMSFML
jgi:hypothetical protein